MNKKIIYYDGRVVVLDENGKERLFSFIVDHYNHTSNNILFEVLKKCLTQQ